MFVQFDEPRWLHVMASVIIGSSFWTNPIVAVIFTNVAQDDLLIDIGASMLRQNSVRRPSTRCNNITCNLNETRHSKKTFSGLLSTQRVGLVTSRCGVAGCSPYDAAALPDFFSRLGRGPTLLGNSTQHAARRRLFPRCHVTPCVSFRRPASGPSK